MRLSAIGKHKFWLGKKHSEETKQKISKSHKGKLNGGWKGGKRHDTSGYILILMHEHPFSKRGYVRKHRLIVEKHLNRYLTEKEVVHHINGIKDDNRTKNLYLFPSQGKHIGYHFSKNKPILKCNIL